MAFATGTLLNVFGLIRSAALAARRCRPLRAVNRRNPGYREVGFEPRKALSISSRSARSWLGVPPNTGQSWL